ncbi:MAG: hypothetical protein R2734_08710 [Nocardioides sp.]
MFVLPVFVFMAYGFARQGGGHQEPHHHPQRHLHRPAGRPHMFVVLAPDRGRDIGSCTVTEPTGQQAVQQALPGSGSSSCSSTAAVGGQPPP